MLKTPEFWYHKRGVLAYLLYPLGVIYGVVAEFLRQHKSKKSKDIGIPVISIGNIVMGGSGKTPTAIALSKVLKEMEHAPHIITRGYGGEVKEALLVNLEVHTAKDVGDEALLLAKAAPTWVDPLRVNAALKAKESGATILILDDAHQNERLHKDLSLLVIDGKQMFGNEFVFPAGPLREFLNSGLNRADGILFINNGKSESITNLKCYNAVLKPTYDSALLKQKVVAFSGLGFNQKFLETLKSEGFQVSHFEDYPDHYAYAEKDLEYLANIAQNYGAKLVTTAKDYVKIPGKFKDSVHVVEVELELSDLEEFKSWLKGQNLK